VIVVRDYSQLDPPILYSFENKDIGSNIDEKETCKFEVAEYNPDGFNIARNRSKFLLVVITLFKPGKKGKK
jgi:hypothetical protein